MGIYNEFLKLYQSLQQESIKCKSTDDKNLKWNRDDFQFEVIEKVQAV